MSDKVDNKIVKIIDALNLFLLLENYGKGLIETVWSFFGINDKMILLFLNKEFTTLCIRLNSSPLFRTTIYLLCEDVQLLTYSIGVKYLEEDFNLGLDEDEKTRDLTNLLKYFPVFDRLDLQFSINYRQCGISMSVLYNHPNMQKFLRQLRFCVSSDQGLIGIKLLQNLIHLDLVDSFKLTNNGLQYLEGLTSLRMLEVSECPRITTGIKHIATLSNLLSLKLCNFNQLLLDDKAFTLLSSLKQLRRLRLNFCNLLIDSGIKVLSSEMSSLYSLNIAYCDNITDLSLLYIAKGLPKLLFLNVAGCYQLTDESLKALKRSRRKLKILTTIP